MAVWVKRTLSCPYIVHTKTIRFRVNRLTNMWTFFLPSSFSDGPLFRGRFFLVDLFSVGHFSVDFFSVDVISVDLFSYNLFIDRVAGAIIRLVASVCPSVCLWALSCLTFDLDFWDEGRP